MRVAIPTWEGRISPVFDTARHLVCFDVTGECCEPAGEMTMSSDLLHAKLATLNALRADVLLCGAISRPLAETVSAGGIRVIPFLAGEVNDVVAAFASGQVAHNCYRMPGCHGRRRHRQRRHCGGRWEE